MDYMTATPRDVIERSAEMHPSLLADRLRQASVTHYDYARNAPMQAVRESAEKLGQACNHAMHNVQDGRVDLICRDFSQRIVAFQVACDLLLVPRSIRGDIIARNDC
jgi:hypothetical protein